MSDREVRMTKILTALLMMSSISVAHAEETKMKLQSVSGGESTRQVAQVEDVARPESLKYDSMAYKKHKEYLRYLDHHMNK
jgi:hypothetical protein